MKSWYNKNDCEHLSAYHAYYPIPAAAMLWCRHVSREHLKARIAKEHPAGRPAFLFDEIERKTHAAIMPTLSGPRELIEMQWAEANRRQQATPAPSNGAR